ncbi:hypothetical protein EVAR_50551_1 [Eumeta japonica]|uniref:Uncharacterized protein n=1 Tax=Eumeta variegata TaxID=151549 RepID=A0A4C2ADM3_EUMVA|nr:hypothetical protein EVAR_50551_1 [Eumeta japonica]
MIVESMLWRCNLLVIWVGCSDQSRKRHVVVIWRMYRQEGLARVTLENLILCNRTGGILKKGQNLSASNRRACTKRCQSTQQEKYAKSWKYVVPATLLGNRLGLKIRTDNDLA